MELKKSEGIALSEEAEASKRVGLFVPSTLYNKVREWGKLRSLNVQKAILLLASERLEEYENPSFNAPIETGKVEDRLSKIEAGQTQVRDLILKYLLDSKRGDA